MKLTPFIIMLWTLLLVAAIVVLPGIMDPDFAPLVIITMGLGTVAIAWWVVRYENRGC